jgi:DNA-binding protein YbaB
VIISPDAMQEDAETLSDMVTTALQDAYQKSTETMRDRMEDLTGGLNLPGL